MVALLLGCQPRRDVAARVEDQELTVDELAWVVARQSGLEPRADGVRRMATWWVEYQLFARQVVAGDSMLDSATIAEVLWPEARGYVLSRFREELLASRLPLDSALLDSAYQAGNQRLIQHVLIRVDRDTPREVNIRRRRKAEALRGDVVRSGSWAAANRVNEDAAARAQGGSIGVIQRGQAAPAFEQVAFALQPGEISAVVETQFGFHILRRPPLSEVREKFRAGIEPLIAEQLERAHLRQLAERRRLTLKSVGLEHARQAVRDPLRYIDSRRAFATFDGGRFTLADLVRWLRAVPDRTHAQIERGPDEQLSEFLHTMMGYELMYLDAGRSGVTLSPEELLELKGELSERLDQLKTALNVYPPGSGDSASAKERERRAAKKVNQYFRNLPDNWQQSAPVPVLLAEKLKRTSDWAIYRRGINRTMERAAELRAVADSLAAASR